MNKFPIYGKGQEMNAQTYAQTPSYMSKANACGLENPMGMPVSGAAFRGMMPAAQQPEAQMPSTAQMPTAAALPAGGQLPSTGQMQGTAAMPSAGQGAFAPITPLTEPMPVTLESMQYINGYLRTQIGRKVTIQFLIGTNTMQDRTGTLLAVGANYVIIREVETDDMLVCDFFSIKFVRIYF
jgi:hypothetical protein